MKIRHSLEQIWYRWKWKGSTRDRVLIAGVLNSNFVFQPRKTLSGSRINHFSFPILLQLLSRILKIVQRLILFKFSRKVIFSYYFYSYFSHQLLQEFYVYRNKKSIWSSEYLIFDLRYSCLLYIIHSIEAITNLSSRWISLYR